MPQRGIDSFRCSQKQADDKIKADPVEVEKEYIQTMLRKDSRKIQMSHLQDFLVSWIVNLENMRGRKFFRSLRKKSDLNTKLIVLDIGSTLLSKGMDSETSRHYHPFVVTFISIMSIVFGLVGLRISIYDWIG